MKYAVVKSPMPATEAEIQKLIKNSEPPGFKLITMTVDGGDLILVYAK
jgi:hypothetical protein